MLTEMHFLLNLNIYIQLISSSLSKSYTKEINRTLLVWLCVECKFLFVTFVDSQFLKISSLFCCLCLMCVALKTLLITYNGYPKDLRTEMDNLL